MAPIPGRTLRCPAKVDTGFAIGSMLRLQVPRVRMANGWALGKFGGEFGQGTANLRRRRTGAIYLVISEVGQLQSSLFLRRESRQGTS